MNPMRRLLADGVNLCLMAARALMVDYRYLMKALQMPGTGGDILPYAGGIVRVFPCLYWNSYV
jgi:hypothetical protein